MSRKRWNPVTQQFEDSVIGTDENINVETGDVSGREKGYVAISPKQVVNDPSEPEVQGEPSVVTGSETTGNGGAGNGGAVDGQQYANVAKTYETQAPTAAPVQVNEFANDKQAGYPNVQANGAAAEPQQTVQQPVQQPTQTVEAKPQQTAQSQAAQTGQQVQREAAPAPKPRPTAPAPTPAPIQDDEDARLRANIKAEYGNSLDDILNDPNMWAIYKPILKGQVQNYLDAKRKAPTPEQREKVEKYNVMNKAAAALAQLGSAIGAGVNATRGPVGGAKEPADYMKPVKENEAEQKKIYDDAIKELKDARDKLGDTASKAAAYQYKNKLERENAEKEEKRYQDKLAAEKAKADQEWTKWVAKNARDNAESKAKIDELAARTAKHKADAAKSNTEKGAAKSGQYISMRVGVDENGNGGKDIYIKKDKWTTENISQAFGYLSDDAKTAIYEYAQRNHKPTQQKKQGGFAGMMDEFNQRNDSTANAGSEWVLGQNGQIIGINIDTKDHETEALMRMAIGQWLNKEGCEKALNFVKGLVEDDKMEVSSSTDFRRKKYL